jgi:hypothetical protein
MAEGRPISPDRVPTLTDVLHATHGPAESAVACMPGGQAHDDGSALTAELLGSIQERIDTLFQARLREAVAPALARAVDGLLRELGPELASAMRETAERAVAQELARRRRSP